MIEDIEKQSDNDANSILDSRDLKQLMETDKLLSFAKFIHRIKCEAYMRNKSHNE